MSSSKNFNGGQPPVELPENLQAIDVWVAAAPSPQDSAACLQPPTIQIVSY